MLNVFKLKDIKIKKKTLKIISSTKKRNMYSGVSERVECLMERSKELRMCLLYLSHGQKQVANARSKST